MNEAGLRAEFLVQRSFEVEVSFWLAPGERLALLGPSGAGKSTILGAIAGLVAIERGMVVLDGHVLSCRQPGPPGRSNTFTLPLRARSISLVAQESALFPHMTVLENVAYGARDRSRDSVGEMIAAFGISELVRRRPGELSGGQQARVALARALARQPRAVLLDEPLSSLDHLARREVLELMTEVIGSLGVPSILVTHELSEAQRFADRLGLLDRGRVLQLGDPSKVVARPAIRRAAEIVGYREFLEVPSARAGSRARYVIGVHPSKVVLVSVEKDSLLTSSLGVLPEGSLVLEGTIVAVWPEGAGSGVSVRLDSFQGARVTCSVPFGLPLIREGSRCQLALVDPPIFDSAGAACQSEAIRAELQRELCPVVVSGRASNVQ